ncbi:MAG: iron(III) transport system substrate-binding protein, partial [Gammaproteobacteria bacterium]
MYKIKLPLMASVLAVVLSTSALAAEVNVYSARKEALIKPLLDKFSAETGIKTNLITAKADKLLTRMINEGRNTPVDLFITVDAGRLHRAKEANLLQPINNSTIEKTVPAHLRDSDQYWVGLSQRARVI